MTMAEGHEQRFYNSSDEAPGIHCPLRITDAAEIFRQKYMNLTLFSDR